MQSVVILLPNLNLDELVRLVRSMLVKTGFMYLVFSVSKLVWSMVPLHDLVNKTRNEDMGGLEAARTKHPR